MVTRHRLFLAALLLSVGDAPAARTGSDGLLELPAVVSPGETIEAGVRDPVRTPPGGRWTVAGAEASQREGRLQVRLPVTLGAGEPITVQYRDPTGRLTVDARVALKVRPALRSLSRPSLADVSAHAVAGGEACVCGSLPPGSWDGLRLAGQPLQRSSASGRAVRFRVPAGLAPGAHVLTGDPAAGFRPTDQLVMRIVRLSGRSAHSSLRVRQQTSVEVQVEGTEEPLDVRLDNASPRVAVLEGEQRQAVRSSGGADNGVRLGLRGQRWGRFLVHYALDLPSACACAEEDEGDAPPLFVPGRVLALVRPAAAEPLPGLARSLAAAHGLVVEATYDLRSTGEGLVLLLGATDVRAKVAALQRDRRVLLAQPDYLHETAGAVAGAIPGSGYGPGLIGADRLPPSADGRGVTVGLIDTGVDARHRLLAAKIGGQEDFTGEGVTADVHGTMIAGLIVADPAEGGLRGIAPGARLMVLKACRPESPRSVRARCQTSALIRALDRAALLKPQVLNLSLEGPRDEGLARYVRAAVREGCVAVAAAGHGDEGAGPDPAALDEVLAVTAVDAAGVAYPRARRGAFVDVAAPGVEVVTTIPGNGRAVSAGTSLAAAVASGAVAVLVQHAPGLTPAEARELIERTARDLGPAGKDPQFGSGLLDLCAALARAPGERPACR